MRIVIDGYNLLKRDNAECDIGAHARTTFVSCLARYAKRKGHSVVVVFDGGPYQWPYTERTKGVLEVYSGERMSADEYIKDYIVEHKTIPMLLVTSDRVLNEWADVYGVHSIDSHYFAQFLYSHDSFHTAMHKKGELFKMSSTDNAELDGLMKNSRPLYKEHMVPVQKIKNKLSKHDRAMIQVLKKL